MKHTITARCGGDFQEIEIDDECSYTCKCGEYHSFTSGIGHIWKCPCGEWYYADPADKIWGTEALRYAHETHGYFPKEVM